MSIGPANSSEPAFRLSGVFGLGRYHYETLGFAPGGAAYTTVALQDCSNSFAADRGRQALAKALPKRNTPERRIQSLP